ncbi:DUF6773 family protein [Paenibacillus glacialis]|uniref:Uncharacterized protein n=1 Tax=Paenibacillus glacialis TaxID=494026 RepID=A0A168MAA4_9BACL|nr:DUF6773 family protein [Paenibacillus glacialis]OAB44431.1 hypothetical protein PGLA_07190 [Paenibacillus glacialis]
MKWWTVKKKSVDERIVNTRNKLYKETYILVYILFGISVIVKILYFDQNIRMMITEIVIFGVASLYYGTRSILLGLYSDEVEIHDQRSKLPMSIKNVIWGLGIGVALALCFGIRSAIVYGDGGLHSLQTFFIVFIASIMIYIPFLSVAMLLTHHFANQASKKAAQKDLDD